MLSYSYSNQQLDSRVATSPSSTETRLVFKSSADEECKSTSDSHLPPGPISRSSSSCASTVDCPLSLSSNCGELKSTPNRVDNVSPEILPQLIYTCSSQQLASQSVLPLSSTCGVDTINREAQNQTGLLEEVEESIQLELSSCSFSSKLAASQSPDSHGISCLDSPGCSVQVKDEQRGIPMEEPGNSTSLISDNSEQSTILSNQSDPIIPGTTQQSNTEKSCKGNDINALPTNHGCASKSSANTNDQGLLSSEETIYPCQGSSLSSKETNDQSLSSASSSKETNDPSLSSASSRKETNDPNLISASSSKETNDSSLSSASASSSKETNDPSLGSTRSSEDSSCKSYNFVIISHEADADASDQIFLFLEEKHQLRGFKIGRDDTPGTYKADEVIRAIKRSEKILLLFTPKSIDNGEFKFQMSWSLDHSITDGGTKLIPIRYGIAQCQTPEVLRYRHCINYDDFSDCFQAKLSRVFHSHFSLASSVSKKSDSHSASTSCSMESKSSTKSSDSPELRQSHSTPPSSRIKQLFNRFFSSPK